MVWYFYIKVNYKLQSERRLRSLMVRCEQCGVLTYMYINSEEFWGDSRADKAFRRVL